MLVVLFVVSFKEFFWVMNVKVIFCTKLCFTSPTGWRFKRPSRLYSLWIHLFNVGSFVWGTTAQRVWGTCEVRIAKRLPKPDFISRWWLQNDLLDTICMVLVIGWHARQVNTLNTWWKDGTILCRETIESNVKVCP